MKKEKIIRSYKRRTKSGKIITVRQHRAKYDARDIVTGSLSKKSGEELANLKTNSLLPFEESDFLEWYEGSGSAGDKKVEKVLKNTLGDNTYNNLNDLAADTYTKKGGKDFLTKNIVPKYKYYQRQSQSIKQSIWRVIGDLRSGKMSSYSGMCYEPSVEEIKEYAKNVCKQEKDISIKIVKAEKSKGTPWRSIRINLKK